MAADTPSDARPLDRGARLNAIQILDALSARMSRGLAALCEKEGRLSRGLLDRNQPAAFALARSLAELEACRAISAWAESTDAPLEHGLADLYVARIVRAFTDRIRFGAEQFGLVPEVVEPLERLTDFVQSVNSQSNIDRLAALIEEGGSDKGGSYGLGDDHVEMRRLFARFADERVAPLAEHIHRHDEILPEDLLAELAERDVRPRVVVGFAAETNDVDANARAKLARKRLDGIVANDVSGGRGFGTADNTVALIGATGDAIEVGPAPKREVADAIVSWCARLLTEAS